MGDFRRDAGPDPLVLNNFDPAHAKRYPGYYGYYSYGSRYHYDEGAVTPAERAERAERHAPARRAAVEAVEQPEAVEPVSLSPDPNGRGEPETAVEGTRARDVEDWR